MEVIDYIKAFAVGGVFAVIAQILIDKTKLTPARILVGYVVGGVLLTGIGVYKYIVDFAGCGATVPLSGFGFALANGVKEAVDQYGAIGILTGGLTATSAGICTAICLGFIVALLCRSKMK